MKTLSLKVLGCAAALTLLTNARAQDDVQAVPPPDTNVQSTDTAPAQQQTQPPVVIMQVPVDGAGNGGENNDAQQDVAPGAQSQPNQNNQPNQQFRYNQGNRYGNGGNGGFNNDRGGRGNRNFGRDNNNGGQRGGINSVPVGDSSNFMPPTTGGTNGTDGLILNFRDTQIDQVLNYLSDAAGFIIELDVPRLSGTVSVWSARPVSRNDAVTILNSALAKNGYAVIQAGRILRVMSKDDALHEVPVIVNGDPDQIPQTGDMVTQIIPVRYVSARQLISDLSLLTPSTATILANDAGNSIIVTDTQQNIHHLAELIKAIDSSAEDVTEVQVFQLKYHDPVEVANLLTQIFTDQGGQNGGQTAPIRFGGFGGLAAAFGGGGRGGFGGGRGGGGFGQFFGRGGQGGQGGQQGGNQGSVRPRAKVVAVADQRMQSVLVTAPKDLMAQVQEVVTEIDKESPKVAQVSVVHLDNADPTVVLKALQDFQANGGRNTTANQNGILSTRANQALSTSTSGFGTSSTGGGGGFGGGGGGGFGGGGGGGLGGGGFRGGGQ